MIIFSRRISFMAGVFMMSVAGTIYAYPSYGSQFRNLLNYDASDVSNVGVWMSAGTWLSFLGGYVLDLAGPKVAGIGGSLLAATGYILLHLGSVKTIPHSAWTMCAYAFLTGQGSSVIYAVSLKINSKNYREDERGQVMGCLVSFFGLCSGLFVAFNKAFFNNDAPSFLLFCAIAVGGVGLAGTVLVNFVGSPSLATGPAAAAAAPGDNKQQRRRRHSKVLPVVTRALTMSLLLILYLFVASLVETFVGEHFNQPFGYVLCVLVAGMLLLGLGEKPCTTAAASAVRASENENGEDGDADVADDSVLLPSSSASLQSSGQIVAPSMPLHRAVRTIDFWLLFFVFMVNVGSAFIVLQGSSELVISRAWLPGQAPVQPVARDLVPQIVAVPTILTFFSLFNTVGRLTAGLFADRAPSKNPETLLVASSALMCVTMLAFAFTPVPVFYGAVVPLGLAYGFTFLTLPLLTSRVFGINFFGQNFGFMGLAPALGSQLISVVLASRLDDEFTSLDSVTVINKGEAVHHCIGLICYMYSFLTAAGLCFLATLTALFFRHRRLKALKLRQKMIN